MNKEMVKFEGCYPFLYEIVNKNHDYILKLDSNEDFDSYIILMNLYLYTCKFMKIHKIPLTCESIYENMHKLFSIKSIRTEIIRVFSNHIKSIEGLYPDTESHQLIKN